MKESTMKVAIIGFGGRITEVYRNFSARAGARQRLVGWADPQTEPSGLSKIADAGRGFRDHREMLRELAPDAVMVGSPNHLHLEHIRDSLAAGCKVFSEKPVVITVADSWAAAELLQKYGQENFLVGLVLRSSPLFREALKQVASGRLGRPVSMEANEHLCPAHGAYIARDWRRLREYSGSHILEKCCHDIDLLQAMMGARIRRVASFGGRSVFVPEHAERAANPEYTTWKTGWEGAVEPFTANSDIVDHQVFSAEMENSSRLTFHCNNHHPWGQRRWAWVGTSGAWESDFNTGTWRVQECFGEPQIHHPPGNAAGGHYGADEAMADDLVATWFDGKPFPVPTKAAIEAGLAAMGIDEAQRSGQVFDLGPWWAKLDALVGA